MHRERETINLRLQIHAWMDGLIKGCIEQQAQTTNPYTLDFVIESRCNRNRDDPEHYHPNTSRIVVEDTVQELLRLVKVFMWRDAWDTHTHTHW